METHRAGRIRCPRRSLPAASILVLATTLSAGVASGSARDGVDAMGYLQGGGALPVHPAEFDEFWRIGWNAGVGVGVPVAPEWEIAAQFQYQRHGADQQGQVNDLLLSGPGGIVVPVASIDGRDLTILTLMAEARFLVPSRRRSPTWFLAFGFGVGEVFTSDATVASTDPALEPITILGDSDTAFTSSTGGGVEIDISENLRLTLDSIYTLVFTEQTSTQFLPVRIGLARRFH